MFDEYKRLSNEQGSDDIGRRAAIKLVLEERDFQVKRWGTDRDKKHTMQQWSTILSVYSGKVASCTEVYSNDRKAFKKRTRQLAAVALAALEAIEED